MPPRPRSSNPSILAYESEVQSSRGVGLTIPPRESDLSGRHPSWWPFQYEVPEEWDDPDPDLMPTRRHFTIF